jgi:hypothetical protein
MIKQVNAWLFNRKQRIHLIQSGSMESCLAAQKHILYFKGPWYFKKRKTSAEIKGLSIDAIHTHPPFSF